MNGKVILPIFVKLLPAIGSLVLWSCGGGGGDENEVNIRPSSLNGITLSFPGAKLTFSSPNPNQASGSTETGGIVYEKTSDTKTIYTPTDSASLDAVNLAWPEDLGSKTFYQYTPIDGTSGRLLIFANNTEDEAILNHPNFGSDFDSFTLTFTASGGVITGVTATVVIKLDNAVVFIDDKNNKFFDTGRFAASLTPGIELSSLNDQRRDVPAGWNGINNGPGFVADPSFEGKTLTLTESSTKFLVFDPFVATTALRREDNSNVESGTVTITVTDGATNPTFNANYRLVQPFGTERADMEITYLTGSVVLPVKNPETFALTFQGGGKISVTGGATPVDKRSGSYTRDSSEPGGTFILDRN